MSFYSAAPGWDVPSVDLVLLSPQPASTGVQVARRTYSANRTIYDQGRFTVWRWNMVESDEVLADILDYFDLSITNTTRAVTIRAPEAPGFAYNRFNGIAHAPRLGETVARKEYFIRDLEIYITDLVYAGGV